MKQLLNNFLGDSPGLAKLLWRKVKQSIVYLKKCGFSLQKVFVKKPIAFDFESAKFSFATFMPTISFAQKVVLKVAFYCHLRHYLYFPQHV